MPRFRADRQRSIAVLTDSLREPLERAGRRYTALDGRSPEKFEKIVEKLVSLPDWIGVIDGGGNARKWTASSTKYRGWCCCHSRLPRRHPHGAQRSRSLPQSLRNPVAMADQPWQQMAAERTLDELMQDYRSRLLSRSTASAPASCCWKPSAARVAERTEQRLPPSGLASAGADGSAGARSRTVVATRRFHRD